MDGDLEDLRERIRARLHDAQLPRDPDPRIFAGAGDGQACVCCDKAISHEEVQYDLHLNNGGGEAAHYAMHVLCFQLWREGLSRLAPQDR